MSFYVVMVMLCEDAMDRIRWMKQIGTIDDHDRCEWVNVSSGTGSPGLFRTKCRRAVKRLCVYVVMVIIFVFCYWRILVTIRRQASLMAGYSGARSNIAQIQSKQIQKIIRTMLLVSLLYVVTYTPGFLVMRRSYPPELQSKHRIALTPKTYYVTLT